MDLVAPTNTLTSNELQKKTDHLVAPMIQQELFHVETQMEHDGVEMGVLENGIPYLSEAGLARMCGVDRKNIYNLAKNWQEEKNKKRGIQINKLLQEANYFGNNLYLESEINGVLVNAYPDVVCMAILEYYAFLATKKKQEAISAFRSLAKTSFKAFIYKITGYSPESKMLNSWRHFHDRIDITAGNAPISHFSIFNEIACMLIPMIKNGILISDKVVPDISVGIAWGKYWKSEKLEDKCGERIRYSHEYPLYYPQSESNPQMAFAYPNSALAIFRDWLYNVYIAKKLPSYLLNQAKLGKLPNNIAQKTINAFHNSNNTLQ